MPSFNEHCWILSYRHRPGFVFSFYNPKSFLQSLYFSLTSVPINNYAKNSLFTLTVISFKSDVCVPYIFLHNRMITSKTLDFDFIINCCRWDTAKSERMNNLVKDTIIVKMRLMIYLQLTIILHFVNKSTCLFRRNSTYTRVLSSPWLFKIEILCPIGLLSWSLFRMAHVQPMKWMGKIKKCNSCPISNTPIPKKCSNSLYL